MRVAELVSFHVSLTCSFGLSWPLWNGLFRTEWRLTRESGQPPAECDLSCQHPWRMVQKRAYLVLDGGPICQLFALLSLEGVEDLYLRVLPYVLLVRNVNSLPALEVRLFFPPWTFSGSADCGCGQLCNACSSKNELESRYLLQACYEGLYPLGEDHWWTGVTDAVPFCNGFRRFRWLACL